MNNLGLAHKELGDSAKAIEYYQQALAIAKRCCEAQIAREIHNRKLEQIALSNLGLIYYISLGDAQKTIEFAQQALVVARQIKNNFLEGRALIFC